MEDINLLVTTIKNQTDLKDSLKEKIDSLSLEVKKLDAEIDELKSNLIELMDNANSREITFNDIVASIFEKENVSYKDEQKVLEYLKSNGYEKFIKVKTSESIDKVPLKKALKDDAVLNNALTEMTEKSVTRYVVVCDSETHQRMLEHIEKK